MAANACTLHGGAVRAPSQAITPGSARSALFPPRTAAAAVRRAARNVVIRAQEDDVIDFGGPMEPPFSDLLDDVLECPTLRDQLQGRDSPFVRNKNFGGGFVDDRDRVALSSMLFASENSSGASCRGGLAIPLDDFSTNPRRTYSHLVEASMEQVSDAYNVAYRTGYQDTGDINDEVCVPLPTWAIRAGARQKIYFNPAEVNAAIVTCGGLCPGLNDVVQGLVNKLEDYGVPQGNIIGIKYGFRGFYDREAKPVVLTRENVEGIHLAGGTILGTSRGGADMKEIVKRLDMWGIDMLFVVGGNGGNAGANAIQQACAENEVKCAVVGVPKSIDNDILLIDRCFGFETAVEESQRALMAAKVEASSARNGIGLVKLMGRQSGFIAMNASMASGVTDVCLIPEVDFSLEAVLQYVEKRLADKGHMVICVAEGAGQEMMEANSGQTDASGNPVLQDIGVFMLAALKERFPDGDIKYIDPTYMIRAIPTTSNDRIYCKVLAHNAVHAAFAGYTGVTTGLVNTHYVYLPIPIVIQAPRKVDPRGKSWNRLRAAIGQPNFQDDIPGEIFPEASRIHGIVP